MSRIAIIGDNSVEYISKLIEIWNSGDCAVIIDWRMPFSTAVRMMKEAGVTQCLIEQCLLDKTPAYINTDITMVSFNTEEHTPVLLSETIRQRYKKNISDKEAVIIYSSGTTGNSKGIILTHKAITINASSILEYMNLGTDDILYIAKSLSHSSTLTGELMVSLLCGCEVLISPMIVPPRYILNNIAKYSVSTICLNPVMLNMIANEYTKKSYKYNLKSLKTIYCSGSILSEKTIDYARRILNGTDIYNVYGLSEAGPRVAAQTKEHCHGNSVGTAISGVEIAVIDDSGNPADIKVTGHIHIKTPSIFGGYVSGNIKHESLNQEWYNTGDIGYIDEFGELHIDSRVDNVIIINAHKIYPENIENIISSNLPVTDCAVAKYINNGIESLGCVYVSREELKSKISSCLKSTLMPYETPAKYIKVNTIPRNQNGKIIRSEVEAILSGIS